MVSDEFEVSVLLSALFAASEVPPLFPSELTAPSAVGVFVGDAVVGLLVVGACVVGDIVGIDVVGDTDGDTDGLSEVGGSVGELDGAGVFNAEHTLFVSSEQVHRHEVDVPPKVPVPPELMQVRVHSSL